MNPALYSLWVESICCIRLLLAAEKGRREAWQGPAILPGSLLEKKGLLVVTKALARDLQHGQWVSDGGNHHVLLPPKVGNTYVTWSGLFRSVLPAPADVALQCAWEALFRQDSSFRELYF